MWDGNDDYFMFKAILTNHKNTRYEWTSQWNQNFGTLDCHEKSEGFICETMLKEDKVKGKLYLAFISAAGVITIKLI